MDDQNAFPFEMNQVRLNRTPSTRSSVSSIYFILLKAYKVVSQRNIFNYFPF